MGSPARGVLPSPAAIAAMWVALFTLTLALYTPYLRAPYFSDDLLFYFSSPPAHLVDYLWMRGAVAHAYRPGEAIILTLIQSRYGMNTLPIHLISIFAHASLCCMIWIVARRLGFDSYQSLLAPALMLVTQVGAPALLGNDTMSQAVSAALGGAACLLMGLASLNCLQAPAGQLPAGSIAASALCYFASLFFKETALGLILVIGLFAVIAVWHENDVRARVRLLTRSLTPFAVLAAVYFAARLHAKLPVSGGGDYRVSFGLNVARNLAEFALIAISPASSVTIALAAQERRLIELGWIAAVIVAVAIVLLASIRTSSRKNLVVVLTLCVMAALFPALILQHVSELYVYNAWAFIALLSALVLGEFDGRGRVLQASMLVCSVLLIVGGIIATRQKASLMDGNGQTAARMMATISRFMDQLPSNSEVWLVREDLPGPKYSVYVLNGLDVLEFGVGKIGPILRRPDVTVKFVSRRQLRALSPDPRRLVLELREGVLTQVAPGS